MARKHKSKTTRKMQHERFQQRYGMPRTEWEVLKKEDPQKAHEMRLARSKRK